MSQPQLLANEASPLISLLTQGGNTYQPLEYSTRSSVGNHIRQRVTVLGKPASELSPGSVQAYQIPRYGCLTDITFRLRFSNSPKATAQDFSSWFPLAMIKSVTLSTHNKKIASIPFCAALFNHTYSCTEVERKRNSYAAGENAGTVLKHTVTGTASTADSSKKHGEFFYRVPLSFFDSLASSLDTSFIESLTCNVELISSMSAITSGAPDVKLENLDMMCTFIQIPDKDRRALQQAQYPPDRSLSILSHDYYEEASVKMDVVGTTYANRQLQTITLPIRNNGVMSHLCFRLRRLKIKTNGSGADLNQLTDESYNIGQCLGVPTKSYDAGTGALDGCTDGWVNARLTASGIEMINVGNSELALMGFGGDTNRSFGVNSNANTYTMSKDQDGYSVICFGIESRATNYSSGVASVRELVDCRLHLDFYAPNGGPSGDGTHLIKTAAIAADANAVPAVAAAAAVSYADGDYTYTYQLECFSKQVTLTSISSSDGRVSQAIAS